ncbi:hypothetical protein G6F22_015234 [Rhizopus arrhizus]|nr:hypothetical protein G6F22_015234 [Rhizopus arrhizus]
MLAGHGCVTELGHHGRLADVGVALAAVVGVVHGLGLGDQVAALLHALVQVRVAEDLVLERVALALDLRDGSILGGDGRLVGSRGSASGGVGVLELLLQLADGGGRRVGALDGQAVDHHDAGLLVAHVVLLRLGMGARIRCTGGAPIPDAKLGAGPATATHGQVVVADVDLFGLVGLAVGGYAVLPYDLGRVTLRELTLARLPVGDGRLVHQNQRDAHARFVMRNLVAGLSDRVLLPVVGGDHLRRVVIRHGSVREAAQRCVGENLLRWPVNLDLQQVGPTQLLTQVFLDAGAGHVCLSTKALQVRMFLLSMHQIHSE